MALLNVMHGGQIMLDCEAFRGINTCLPSIAQSLPDGPDLTLLMPAHRLTLASRYADWAATVQAWHVSMVSIQAVYLMPAAAS